MNQLRDIVYRDPDWVNVIEDHDPGDEEPGCRAKVLPGPLFINVHTGDRCTQIFEEYPPCGRIFLHAQQTGV